MGFCGLGGLSWSGRAWSRKKFAPAERINAPGLLAPLCLPLSAHACAPARCAWQQRMQCWRRFSATEASRLPCLNVSFLVWLDPPPHECATASGCHGSRIRITQFQFQISISIQSTQALGWSSGVPALKNALCASLQMKTGNTRPCCHRFPVGLASTSQSGASDRLVEALHSASLQAAMAEGGPPLPSPPLTGRWGCGWLRPGGRHPNCLAGASRVGSRNWPRWVERPSLYLSPPPQVQRHPNNSS